MSFVDCCDGSDEYNGNVNCPNTCWEAGKVAREKLQKKIATFQNGVTIRKQEVEKAKQAFAKDEAELSKLKNEEKILKELVQKLKDCCDGSDEYNGNVNCPNTCWEAGKVAREKLQKKIATFQNGVTIRKQEVEKAKQAFAKDEAELSKLKNEEKILKELVQKLKEQKEQIEKAQEEERKKKEEEERRLKEAERKANESKKASEESTHDSTDQAPEKLSELHYQDAMEDHHDSAVEDKIDYTTGTEISDNQAVGKVANDHDDSIAKSGHETDGRSDGSSFSHLEKQHVVGAQDNAASKANTDYPGNEEELSGHVAEQGQVSDSTEGLSREELGRLVASRWTQENVAEGNDEVNTAKEEGHEHDEDIPEENHDGYNSDSDEDHKFEDDDSEDDLDTESGEDHEEPTGAYSSDEDDKTDYSDLTVSGGSSWLDKIQQTVNNVLQAFNFFRRPVNMSEAATVRKEYADLSSKLSKIQSRISSLDEKLKHDFVEDKIDYTTGTEISDNQAVGKVANDHDDSIAKSGHETDGRSDGSSFSHLEKQHVVGAQDNAASKANTDYPGNEEELSGHVAEQGQVSDSTEGLSREELGRLVASRWTQENVAEGNDEVNTAKEEGHEHDEDIPEENHDGYNSDSDEDHKFEDDDSEDDLDTESGEDHEEPTGAYSSDEDDKTDYSDLTVSGGSSWLDKIQQTVNNVLQAFNFFRRPVNMSEAATVRKEYADLSSKLSKIQSRISSLDEKLKHDFDNNSFLKFGIFLLGKDSEFYSFYNHCFESKQNKYTYKVCPFKKASQVRLRCGLKDELVDIDEPSRCEYVAMLSTPALCLEEKLKELQQKLEDMNTGQPLAHDEL
ncbi:hypothetical protein COCNU_04G011720 [Cocos nucifera]|uniref:Glucosidase 2 subunit beta-like domain-containing protein n=1 Tax=Cocos nucifera TaxID=13894 RepID=A0A8K0I6Q5_COCNU|nr:hypothetical protein COCNU_04G011720 [Cocos nucifera]